MVEVPQSNASARPDGLPLETARLNLRAFVPGDAAKLFRMSQEESMRTWLWSQVYRDEAHAASVLAFLISQYGVANAALAPYVLGVQARESGELIGHVGFSPLGDAVEVGFAIEDAHQRKGFATEAVRAACEWAVREFSLAAIIGVTSARNRASQGVLLRAGFSRQEEKLMRMQGKVQPVIVFSFAR